MFGKTETREFETPHGKVRVKLFEGRVGWSMNSDSPELFAWGLSGRKYDRMHLTELEQIKLNQQYFEWISAEGCNKCWLNGLICAGLQPIPFEHYTEGLSVTVKNYQTHFIRDAIKVMPKEKVKDILKHEAACKPKHW
jgi:hypothetical protein